MFINALEKFKPEAENENLFLAIDVHLARYVYEQTLHNDEAVKINLACTCLALYQAQQRGHSALPFDVAVTEVNRIFKILNLSSLIEQQNMDDWKHKLALSEWVCELDDINLPCHKALAIIPKQQLIALQRNLHLEQKIADKLKNLNSESGNKVTLNAIVSEQLKSTLNLTHLDENQLAACIKAKDSQLSIICGGPGSGKTTTVFQLLNILVSQFSPAQQNTPLPRIALAACTGKAAARLNQSLQQQAKQDIQPSELHSNVFNSSSLKATTLHRLLAYSNKRQSFRYNKENKLAIDILIVDEVSMLDFNLLLALLDALPKQCQLILLGDNNQLPAVEYGDLLSTLEQTPLKENMSYLKGQYRFKQDSSLAQILKLIQTSNSHQTLEQFLTAEQDSTFEFLDYNCITTEQLWTDIFDSFTRYFERITDLTLSIEDKITSLYDFKILCPFHDGEFGIDNINHRIDQYFNKKSLSRPAQNKNLEHSFYNGQAIMILKNNYQLNLFNGDMGIILYNQELHKFEAYFIMSNDHGEQSARAFNPAQLTDYKSAYAMSIHKSQGSEFKRLMLMIAPAMSHSQAQLLQRKLVYTGISRAQHKLTLCADKDTFLNACETNKMSYNSLLALLNK